MITEFHFDTPAILSLFIAYFSQLLVLKAAHPINLGD